MKPIHFSALSLGISAVVAVAAIWYYRTQAASSDSGQATQQPLFQTAAVPSFGAGAGNVSSGASGTGGGSSGTAASSGTTPPGPVTPTGLSAGQLAGIASQQLSNNFNEQQYATGVSGGLGLASIGMGLFQQLVAQLPAITPGNVNRANIHLGTPLEAIDIYSTVSQDVGPYYRPPDTPTPLSYADYQPSQLSFAPPPPEAAPQPSPVNVTQVFMPQPPANPFVDNSVSGSGAE